ncbi:hypothetical protein ACSQ67_011368 [Phaseolus vulgaris]
MLRRWRRKLKKKPTRNFMQRAKIEMTAAAEASKVHTSNLETRCTPQEVNAGKVEGELAAKNEAFNLLRG